MQSYTGEDGYTETYTYNANRLLSSVTTPEATTKLTWDILYGDGVVISETSGKSTTDYTYGLDRISAITGSNFPISATILRMGTWTRILSGFLVGSDFYGECDLCYAA
ncbi:MAG: hypothetical protein IJ049_01780 [Oscillospiraceae bacterium]|nr:hypothetical protein [Oscillospiraceae bacterium]